MIKLSNSLCLCMVVIITLLLSCEKTNNFDPNKINEDDINAIISKSKFKYKTIFQDFIKNHDFLESPRWDDYVLLEREDTIQTLIVPITEPENSISAFLHINRISEDSLIYAIRMTNDKENGTRTNSDSLNIYILGERKLYRANRNDGGITMKEIDIFDVISSMPIKTRVKGCEIELDCHLGEVTITPPPFNWAWWWSVNFPDTGAPGGITHHTPGSNYLDALMMSSELPYEAERKLAQKLNQMLQERYWPCLFKLAVDFNWKMKNISWSASGKTGYLPDTNELWFKAWDLNSMGEAFPEEYIHFLQNFYWPSGTSQYGSYGKPNVEFEAKFILDCINFLNNNGMGMQYGSVESNALDYINWIWGLTDRAGGNFPNFSDLTKRDPQWGNKNYFDFLRDFAEQHPSYKGPYDPFMPPYLTEFPSKSNDCK